MALSYEILVDKGETANKCTILPLHYRQDFAIIRFLRGVKIPALTGDVFIHPDGASLQDLRDENAAAGTTVRRISLVDSLWRRLPEIVALIERPFPKMAKIPEGFVTAYPRRSKKNFDPADGLATIEALFIAAAFFGAWDESLLKEYYFAPQFLALNRDTFKRYGVTPA